MKLLTVSLASLLSVQDWCHGNWVLGNHDNHRLMERLRNDTRLATTAPRCKEAHAPL